MCRGQRQGQSSSRRRWLLPVASTAALHVGVWWLIVCGVQSANAFGLEYLSQTYLSFFWGSACVWIVALPVMWPLLMYSDSGGNDN